MSFRRARSKIRALTLRRRVSAVSKGVPVGLRTAGASFETPFLTKWLLRMQTPGNVRHVLRPRLSAATLILASLAGSVGAWAQTAAAEPAHATPFGGLSLVVLAGTLVAGLVAGAGLAMLRGRQPSLRLIPSRVARRARVEEPEPVRKIVSPPVRVASSARSREKLPPVVALLGSGGESDCDDWLDSLMEGPRFGPRIAGLIAAGDCDAAQAVATIAERARLLGRDVVVIAAGGAVDGLAAAFDRRLGRRKSRRSDPFGASARIEVLEEADLFAPGVEPDEQDWRDAFTALAAGNDIVLVDLPAAEALDEAMPLLAVLDETLLLRGVDLPRPDAANACGMARAPGARETGQIVVEMDQAGDYEGRT